MSLALILGWASLAVWVYLLSARGLYWRAMTGPPEAALGDWPGVAAVVPARDEADAIRTAIASLLLQDYPGRFHVILVDDHSTDGTGRIAAETAQGLGRADRLTVLAARDLPAGWTGKLWAVSEGLAAAERSHAGATHVLLTDADIRHAPDELRRLVAHAEADGLDLVSLMVRLNCRTLAERALVPAFVYFFQMLYPFAWVNRSERPTAAAAGGCMLVRRQALERIGGIQRIRGRLIDDCALAEAVKEGGRIWLGLAQETVSLRVYPRFGDIERMVARSAYTQLRHSPLLLAIAVAGMALVFLAPPALTVAGLWSSVGSPVLALGLASWAMMSLSFAPMLHYYRLSLLWAPLLPAIAGFYLIATLHSALQHWRGRGGAWKGRFQAGGAA
jgi:hopene-associated glycosyltransferase HpnB